MSIIATAVRHLMAAGVTGEALVAAIAEMEAAHPVKDAAAERRRAWDRERKRKAKSGGIPVESAETGGNAESTPLSLSPNENNSNPHTHTPPENTSRARGCDFPRPDWAEPALWADFLANRKAKRLKNTATAHRALLADIARFQTPEWPPPRLLEHATAKGWGAIYQPDELKGSTNGHHGKPAGNDQGPRNPYVRAVLANQAARSADERGQPGGWSEHGTAAF